MRQPVHRAALVRVTDEIRVDVRLLPISFFAASVGDCAVDGDSGFKRRSSRSGCSSSCWRRVVQAVGTMGRTGREAYRISVCRVPLPPGIQEPAFCGRRTAFSGCRFFVAFRFPSYLFFKHPTGSMSTSPLEAFPFDPSDRATESSFDRFRQRFRPILLKSGKVSHLAPTARKISRGWRCPARKRCSTAFPESS